MSTSDAPSQPMFSKQAQHPARLVSAAWNDHATFIVQITPQRVFIVPTPQPLDEQPFTMHAP